MGGSVGNYDDLQFNKNKDLIGGREELSFKPRSPSNSGSMFKKLIDDRIIKGY
jgi:hypothetical protein